MRERREGRGDLGAGGLTQLFASVLFFTHHNTSELSKYNNSQSSVVLFVLDLIVLYIVCVYVYMYIYICVYIYRP